MNSPALIPRNDPRRLAALRALDVGSNAPDRVFDALAGSAAAVCETPIAFVILVDEHRQWFLGSSGAQNLQGRTGHCEFSARLVATGRPLVVPNTALDARFADHRQVTGPLDMQFYAGAPIHCGFGVTLGSVCVADHVPRQLTRHQLLALRRLAGVATRALHSRATALRTITDLRYRATHDALTGMPNRLAFESALAVVLANDAVHVDPSAVLLYLDLDRFRIVNDTCGHAAGDQLLQQIGGVINALLGPGDCMARLGADEFGVLLAHGDVRLAHDVAQRICDQLEDFRFVHQGRRFRIGASIGLVPLQGQWPSVTALLQAADASCRAAKEGGRNRVHVWQASDTALAMRQDEMHWIGRIELALDEDRFALHGQRIEPIGEARPGLHLEALLRMREPDGSLTLPDAFLPVAERFHLATRIDRWVVRTAFGHLARAARDGVPIELMAVNLSGRTLGDPTFHRELIAMIRGAAFDVTTLCIEITETAAVTHLSDARNFIDQVRAFGVKVALDDFGAGASSFGYLKSFPVDYLKIDGRFITHLLDDPIDNAAVRCFCEIAKVQGIRTIAEFVEDDAVRTELHAIGVDLAQGYLIHMPEPLDTLLAPAAPTTRTVRNGEADRLPTTRDRRVTEVPFDLPNPNRLDLDDPAEMLLWADDLSITVDRLREIVMKVGPMRAAIRAYVMAHRRAAARVGSGAHEAD